MSNVQEVPAVIVDNGTHTTKVGLTEDADPEAVFRTLVDVGTDGRCVVVPTAPSTGGIQPIVRGVPVDLDALEVVWEHAFRQVLKVDPREHKVLLTERPLATSSETREAIVQRMFEKFEVPATYLAMQGLMALYAAGRTSGTVLDIGEGLTSVVPIYRYAPQKESIINVPLAGSDMVDYLTSTLAITDRGLAREIMEKVCSVSGDLAKEASTLSTLVYTSGATGTSVNVGKERLLCAEALFGNGCSTSDSRRSVQQLVTDAVNGCLGNTRKELYANVILAGGSTMFAGMGERLQRELEALVPTATYRVKVIAPQNASLTIWTGACLVAQSPLFQQMWITRQEYDEFGASIVHRKCT
ncbi:actin-3-like [Anopheles darlingi]|uniref:actin-3-like n=1 Tax=Anopheles darlingi TaxID=43151 RepID=UPI0021005D6D|nr:actin-3-like [Anopheles darlingi]